MIVLFTAFAVLYFIVVEVLSAGLNRRWTTQPPRPDSQLPTISLLIAARNEAPNIPALFTSLKQIDYPCFEVIFIDDGSTDGTLEIAQSLAEGVPGLKTIRIEKREGNVSSKKHALLHGMKQATGDIIGITDADCVLRPGWLRTIEKHFTPEVGSVYSYSYSDKGTSEDTLFTRLQSFDLLTLYTVSAATSGLNWNLASCGNNFFYRRETYLEAGGYEAILKFVSGDDDLLLQNIDTKTKWKSVYCKEPDAYVYTTPQPNWFQYYRQKKRWASKFRYYRFSFQLFLAFYYLYNLISLAGILLYCYDPLPHYLAPVVVKFVMDGILYLKGTSIFRRTHLMRIFALWFLWNLPWVVFMGPAGQIGGIHWKGIDYRAAKLK